MPCNTDALNAADNLQGTLQFYVPDVTRTVAGELNSIGYSTNGLSAWGQLVSDEASNAGPPPWWVFGLFVLGFTVAAAWLLQTLAKMLQSVPGGSTIAQLFLDAEGWVNSVLHQWAIGQMDGARHIIDATQLAIHALGVSITTLGQALAILYQTAVNTSYNLYNQSLVNAQGLYQTSVNAAYNLYNSAIAHADLLYQTSVNAAYNLYNSAIAHTDATAQVLEQDFTQGLNEIETTFVTELQRIGNAQQQQLGQVETSLQHQAQAGDQSILDYLQGSLLPSLAPALAVAPALAQEVQQLRDECVDPMCRNLGNLSNMLGLLAQLGVDALIIALIAECLRNPGGVVHEIEDVIVEPVRGAYDVFAGLTGAPTF